MAKEKVDAQELALASGFLLGRHFFGFRDMHYGVWPAELNVSIHNLVQAQSNYSDLLLAQIPPGVKSILDVGCGAGGLAQRLIDAGYEVACVSPSPFLTKIAKERLGTQAWFYECRLEEIQTRRRYELILFSESLQYIPLKKARAQALELVVPNGHVLISDYFRTDAPGKSPLSGGHRLSDFYDVFSQPPLEVEIDQDITDQTAPTLKVINDAMMDAVHPIWQMTQQTLHSSYPWISSLALRLLRRKIEKIERKHFSGARSPENFSTYKSYRMVRFKRTAL